HGWNIDQWRDEQSSQYLLREWKLTRARRAGTLLGPEGTGAARPRVARRRRRPATVTDHPHRMNHPATRGRRRHGGGPARTLRTAQWTRASFSKSLWQVNKGIR